jgi:hypothetical protein
VSCSSSCAFSALLALQPECSCSPSRCSFSGSAHPWLRRSDFAEEPDHSPHLWADLARLPLARPSRSCDRVVGMADSKSPSHATASQSGAPVRRRADASHPAVDSPEAQGAAIGVLGVAGGLVWRERRRAGDAPDAVSALTWRGTANVLAWLAGLIALASVCDLVFPGPTALWGFVALVVMLLVARWWDHRGRKPSDRAPIKP